MNSTLHQSASLRYKFEIVRNGKVIKSLPFRDYMITDAGLDKVGTSGWLSCITTPIIGENVSPTPVRRDSGAITFTQSGNTLTASSGFFVASDVGRLFKWGTGSGGNEIYITAFTSSTVVTVGTSATVSTPSVGTIWYVNTASLLTPITGLTWSKLNNASENFSSASTAGSVVTVTHQTVFYSSALASAKTVTEIAFSNSTTNSNIFDRDIVTPSIGLLIGDQAKVTLQLIVNYSPITGLAVGNVATGYDSSGTLQLEGLGVSSVSGGGISYFNSSGSVAGGSAVLEPGTAPQAYCFTTTFTQSAFTSGDAVSVSGGTKKATSNSAYGTGTYRRDSSVTYSISEVNGTIFGWALTDSNTPGARWLSQKYTTSFAKSSSQTLSFTFRKSWSRVLIN